MHWDKVKRAVDIIRKEGYNGILRVLFKLTKSRTDAGKTLDALNLIGALDFSVQDFEANRALIAQFEHERPEVKSINWFIPHFLHAFYGGIYTIFRFAEYLAVDKGIRTRIILFDNPYVAEKELRSKIAAVFPRLADEELYVYKGPDINAVPYADISVATLWTSAYLLMKFRNTRGKFYFIQDYEPLFYPAGTYYALTEATYRFGFHGIINTPGLYDFIMQKHGIKAEYFVPSVDRHIFYPDESRQDLDKQNMKLFFYGRPQHERNAFELSLAIVRKIKTVLGERIEIVAAGSEWNPHEFGVEGMVTNLGLLGYHETAELYRTCDFGLIMMFTKHPSYLPFELMASGCITITNFNTANTWLLKDAVNSIVVEPSPTYATERLLSLIEDPSLCSRIRENAVKTVSETEWETEMEKIHRFITGAGG